MRRAAALHSQQQRLLARRPAHERVDPGPLGTTTPAYAFVQDQCEVHVYVSLPSATPTTALRVGITPATLSVVLDLPERAVLVQGPLYAPVEPSACHWQRTDDLLEVTLAKVYRCDRYPPGKTLADTWWWSLLQGGPRIDGRYPPPQYYAAHGGGKDERGAVLALRK